MSGTTKGHKPFRKTQADCVKTRALAENGLARAEFLRLAGF